MNILLAALSASAHSMNSIALRLYQTKLQKSTADLRLYQSGYMLLAAVAYLVLNGFRMQLDSVGLLLALCYGLDLAMTGTLVSACYQCGPMSVTSVITNACVALPIAVGCIFYREVMTLPQILGCLLLGITFLLSGLGGKQPASRIEPKWYLLVTLAFFANGMGAVLLNIYGRVAGSGERNSYLAVGYGVAALLYFLIHGFEAKKTGKVVLKEFCKPLLPVLLVASSMGGFVGNGLLMSLNTSMPASVLYPMVNGGIGVIVAIVSCTCFREKLTLQKLLAILTGLGSIVLLNL